MPIIVFLKDVDKVILRQINFQLILKICFLKLKFLSFYLTVKKETFFLIFLASHFVKNFSVLIKYGHFECRKEIVY